MSEVDERFALVADNGDRLFPYKKTQKKTARYGFALTRPGEQDRDGGGTYTKNISEVIQRVVNEGWSVRVKTIDKMGRQREGTLGLNKRSVHGYVVDEAFESLVKSSSRKPLSVSRSAAKTGKGTGANLGEDHEENPLDELTYREIKTRRGQPEFRKALLAAFGGKCCVTACSIESVLEAAHIIPHADESNYSVSNGLLLRERLNKPMQQVGQRS